MDLGVIISQYAENKRNEHENTLSKIYVEISLKMHYLLEKLLYC